MIWPGRRIFYAAVLALGVIATPAAAVAAQAVAETQRVNVPVLSAAPPMDGTLTGSWAEAATVALKYDGQYRRAAQDDTVVRVGLYGKSLYAAFVATQRGGVVASQHADGPGVLSDDACMVHLWPNGLQGFAYWFAANPNGARDQYSSENSAFAPTWAAAGKRTPSGYVTEFQIPLASMHAKYAQNWLAQFHRIVVSSNENLVWELEPEQSSYIDPRYGGTLIGLETKGAAPQPRLELYGLDAIASKAAGGSTSRLGADFSVPITGTTSIFGTAHPDFSNVEIDQQSIAPTTFARRFNEVRPFFTQAANAFNPFSGVNTPMSTLYTPTIPTFRGGYGLEGTQQTPLGTLSVAGFDALGYSRTDNAQVLSLSNPAQTLALNLQRVAVHDSAAGVTDLVNMGGLSYFNPHGHLLFFTNRGADSGSNVSDASGAVYQDAGASYLTNTSQFSFALQKMGAQFNPADGFANQPPGDPGLAGYTAVAQRRLNYSPTSRVRDVVAAVQTDRYHGSDGSVNQSDFSDQVQVDFKDLMTVRLFQGNSWLSVCQPVSGTQCGRAFLPFSASGLYVAYAQNTAHPSSVTYSDGAYYHGRLRSWQRIAGLPLTARMSLMLEADDTAYASHVAGEPDTKQWLERASVNYQFNASLSADLGARRIIGTNQPFAFNLFGPPAYENASNVSAAVHFFRGDNELYVVYGDPNSLATNPTLFVKLIRYIGAGKGS